MRLLSYPIDERTPVYAGNPNVKIVPYKKISKGDSNNSFAIEVHCHSGTHIDAPRHFFDDGKKIGDYGSVLRFRAGVVDCLKGKDELVRIEDLEKDTELIRNIDCLLIRTGFWRFRGAEKYAYCGAGIASETIEWIRRNYQNVKCIGVDTISVSAFKCRNDGRKAHEMAFDKKDEFGEPLLLIEDMNLEGVDGEFDIMVVPWQISGVDSVPCSVMVL